MTDITTLRSVILHSQHLLEKSSDSIENIVSDICGLQYDPYPAIHLNQYIMLWNRKKDFLPEQLDSAAYRDFRILETWTFRRNLFFIPADEYPLYKAASGGIVRWGSSDESWLAAGDCPEVAEAERELRDFLRDSDGVTAGQLWEQLNLASEWDRYRRKHDMSCNLPVFRAYFRLIRRGDLLTCGRNPGTFREPVYILKENAGFRDWTENAPVREDAVRTVADRLSASLAVTDPVHVSHLTGYRTADLIPIFRELKQAGRISPLPYRIGRKQYYIHSAAVQKMREHPPEESREVRLISPMDTVVRDKAWLNALFDYSFSFEYFKKKGMKWPLSILAGNRFVGYLDCRMEWKTGKFIVKERTITDSGFRDSGAVDSAVEKLAAFHGAKEIAELP